MFKYVPYRVENNCEKRRNCLFSHNVFHSYISLVRQNVVLCGNGLSEDCTEIDEFAYLAEMISLFSLCPT